MLKPEAYPLRVFASSRGIIERQLSLINSILDTLCPVMILLVQMKTEQQNLGDWIDGLERTGRYSFTLDEVRQSRRMSAVALEKALQRQCAKGRLVRVRRSFYVLVPVAYSSAGCVPAEWFLSDLMTWLQIPYYVGCLSAAALHGAAHQRPQELQVVVPCQVRGIDIPVLRIRFLRFADMASARVSTHRTHTGDIPVSTPEWTAIDLIRFQKQYGSMDAATTVLTELSEMLDAGKLVDAAKHEKCTAYLQRLGWVLDFIGAQTLGNALANEVQARNPSYTALNSSIPLRKSPRNTRWRILENEKPEVDL